MRGLEIELQRWALGYLALETIAFLLAMYVLYLVIKCAIRDGIKESGLVGTWRDTVRAALPRPADTTGLPDMRAER